MKLSDVPELEGWTLLSDAARELNVSRQALYEAAARALAAAETQDTARGRRALRPLTVRKLGSGRPIYVIRTAEIPALRASLSTDAQRRGRMARTEDCGEAQVPAEAASGAAGS